MLFWKKKRETVEELSGEPVVTDGYSAVVETEAACGAVIAVSPNCAANAHDPSRSLSQTPVSPAAIAGSVMAGWRASGVVDRIEEIDADLKAAVRHRLPLVVHWIVDAGHGEYHALAELGCFELFAANVQEAADFALIAHRIAELSLMPGLCAQDAVTARSLQNVLLPAGVAEAYLGKVGKEMASPTPAQQMLFGDNRRNIFCWNDVDHPATTGVVTEEATRYALAQRVFFSDHLVGAVDSAVAEFAKATGRSYARACAYDVEGAEYVVVAQGSLVEDLRAVAAVLRREKLKVGVVNVSMLRPFPGKEIATWLCGKKAVTVLERVSPDIGEDPPLLREVRCALDKAMENGAGKPVHAGYPSYRQLSDRPQLYSGICGLGGARVRLSDLRAAFYNMLPGKRQERSFYLHVPAVPQRFPKQEAMQQRIQREYPRLSQLSLGETGSPADFPEHPTAFSVYLPCARDVWIGDLLARALAKSLDSRVKTSVWTCGEHLVYTAAMSEKTFVTQSLPDVVDVAVVPESEVAAAVAGIKTGGSLVVDITQTPEVFWQKLAEEVKGRIRERKIDCHTLCTVEIAGLHLHLRSHILAGALQSAVPCNNEAVWQNYWQGLKGSGKESLRGEIAPWVDECMSAFGRGRQAAVKLDFAQLGDRPAKPEETPAPWPVKQARADGTVWDQSRFWNSVGYFYATGHKEQILTDPFTSVAIIPARSSALRDLSGERAYTPQLIAERCTGCGMCWAVCPDSSIPGTAQTLSALVQSAIKSCQSEGREMDDIARLEKHIAQQAYRLIAKDGLCQYRTLGPLLKEAYSALTEKMELDAQQRDKLNRQFQWLSEIAENFPIVKTDVFFSGPEKQEKGSGALLSVVVNPATCKACMACVRACPEKALEPIVQSDARLDVWRKNWRYFLQLPPNPEVAAKHIRPQTAVYHMLDKKSHFALVGGDGARAGSGEKTAVRLLTAAVEAEMGNRLRPFIARLGELAEKLREEIREMMSKGVEVRNWEGFAQSLAEVKRQDIDSRALAEILDKSGNRAEIDKNRLERLTVALAQIERLHRLYREGSSGDGRARMIVLSSPDCMQWGNRYPYTPFSFPCTYSPDPVGTSLGVLDGSMRNLAGDFKWVRIAEMEVNHSYNSQMHDDFFANFQSRDLTGEELALCPPVIVVVDSKKAGWDAIFALLSRRLPIKIAILERCGKLPDDREFSHAEPAMIPLLRQDHFVLQTSISAPSHAISGVVDGLKYEGPAVFYFLSPEDYSPSPEGETAVIHADLAVKGRVLPLFKYDPHLEAKLDILANPAVDRDLVEIAGDGRGEKSHWTPAHWAIRQKKWREHWQKIFPSQAQSKMKMLGDYLALPAGERGNFTPVIALDDGGKIAYARLSENLVRFSEECLMAWRFLKEMAQKGSPPIVSPETEAVCKEREEAVRQEFTAKIEAMEKEHGSLYRERLKLNLLSLCKGADAATLGMKLREYLESSRRL